MDRARDSESIPHTLRAPFEPYKRLPIGTASRSEKNCTYTVFSRFLQFLVVFCFFLFIAGGPRGVSRSDQQPGACLGPARGPRNAPATPWRRALAGRGSWAMHGAWATCKPGRPQEHKKVQPPERSHLPMAGALRQTTVSSFWKKSGVTSTCVPNNGGAPKMGDSSKTHKNHLFCNVFDVSPIPGAHL